MTARQGEGRVDAGQWVLRLAAVSALTLVVLAAFNVHKARELQSRLDREHAVAQAAQALRPPLRAGREKQVREAAQQLMARADLGLRYLSVHDARGVVLMTASAYDAWQLPLLPAHWMQKLREVVLRHTSHHGAMRVLHEGDSVGGFEYAISDTLARAVRDQAVERLHFSGWLVLAFSLPVLAGLLLALRRRSATPAAGWIKRLNWPRDATAIALDPEGQIADAVRQRAGQALDLMQFGVIITGPDARVRHLNALAEALTGWSLADARRRLVYSVFHPLNENGEPLVSAAEASLKEGREIAASECRLRGRNGTLSNIEMMACPLKGADGKPDGVAMLFRDIGERHARFEELRRQSRLSQGVVDHVDEGLLTTDPAGVVRFANARALRMFGYNRDEIAGITVTKLMPVPFLNTPGVRLADYSGGSAQLPKVVGWRKDATTFPVELLVQPMSVGADHGLVVVVRDISERLRGVNLASRLGRLLDNALEEIYIFDAQSLHLLEVNRGARRNLGYAQEQLAGMSLLSFSGGLDEDTFHGYLARLRGGETEHLVYRCTHRRSDGSEYPVEVRLNFSREEEPPVYMAIAVDISDRIAVEDRLKHLALHDPLTGLPNRSMLYDRLQQAMLAAGRGGRMVGVLFIDMDRFKRVNDMLGHEVGDQVLKCIAERLKTVLRATDTVARLGGDEFVIVAQGLRSSDDAEMLARKVIEAFHDRLDVPGHDIRLTPSVGISLYPLDDSDMENLLRHADSAMYEAKQAGDGEYRLFSTDLDPDRRRKLELEREIHAAVALNQFHLLGTPIRDIHSGRVRGGVLGFYWQHPRHGRVESDETLRAASRAGLLGDLELWLAGRACGQYRFVKQRQLPVLPMMIPISGWQLRDGDFANHVLHLVQRFELQPGMLILLLTLDGYTEARGASEAVIRKLMDGGVRIGLREMSGGFDLIEAGGRLPVHCLLLAEEVAARLPAAQGIAQLHRALECTRNLGIPLIATGVHSLQARDALREAGCTLMSGDVLAPALRARDLGDWLAGESCEPL